MSETTDAEENLAELVLKLTAAVEVLSYRFRRKRISDAVLAVVVVGMLLLGGFYYFVELPGRRADTRAQIRNLACYAVRLRPPGYSPTSDALRTRYRCPAFDPAAARSATPAPAPSSRRPSTGDASTPGIGGRSAQRPSAAVRSPAASVPGRASTSPQAARTAASRSPAATAPHRPVASAGGRDASSTVPPLLQLPTVSLCSVRAAGLGICPAN